MSYTHGVYTSEVATSIIPSNTAASCLPFVIGYVRSLASGVSAQTAVLCSSWDEFVAAFPDADSAAYEGRDPASLEAFARQWFNRCGGGAAIFVPISAIGSAATVADPASITTELGLIDTCYEQFSLIPTVIVVPGYGSSFDAEICAKASDFGGQWECMGLIGLAYDTAANVLAAKVSSDRHITYVVGCGTYSGEVIDGETVLCGTLAVVDSANQGYPYVSPSNQNARIDGMSEADGTAVYLNRTQANAYNAIGAVTFLRTPKGWCVWGDETSAFPSNTDVKDQFISVSRSFSWLKNDFCSYAMARVDLPLNNRQIEGIVKSYNIKLNGMSASGVLCGGTIAYREEDNSTTDLLNGSIHFHISIAPPPPMRTITGTFEYDVELFTNSLTSAS